VGGIGGEGSFAFHEPADPGAAGRQGSTDVIHLGQCGPRDLHGEVALPESLRSRPQSLHRAEESADQPPAGSGGEQDRRNGQREHPGDRGRGTSGAFRQRFGDPQGAAGLRTCAERRGGHDLLGGGDAGHVSSQRLGDGQVSALGAGAGDAAARGVVERVAVIGVGVQWCPPGLLGRGVGHGADGGGGQPLQLQQVGVAVLVAHDERHGHEEHGHGQGAHDQDGGQDAAGHGSSRR